MEFFSHLITPFLNCTLDTLKSIIISYIFDSLQSIPITSYLAALIDVPPIPQRSLGNKSRSSAKKKQQTSKFETCWSQSSERLVHWRSMCGRRTHSFFRVSNLQSSPQKRDSNLPEYLLPV